jgi:hypothetical protein
MNKEAMKLVLDSLVYASSYCDTYDAITVMREALAEQPAQQKPVGTYGEIFESMRSLLRSGRQADQQIYMAMQHKPLYTSPPAQPAPESGSWYAASDIDKMVRNLDVTMNGDGAAPQAKLCDLMPQLIQRLTAPTPQPAPVQDSTCSETLRAQGKAYPRTCRKCGKGPCIALVNAALDKKAENAREIGLDYEPAYKVTVVDDQHPNGVPLEQWGRVAEQGEDHMRQLIEDLISAMEYHVEQTRPIHSTTVALQAAREAIKAQPAPVQEPVAWVREHELPLAPGDAFSWVETFVHKTPLYTTPPAAQRQWAGLTDEERDDVLDIYITAEGRARAIEAKLKELNT